MTTTAHTSATITDMDPAQRLRRRQHLDQLLSVRARLAETAAYYRAHGLSEDAEDIALRQYAVEATINEQFRDTYAREWPAWVAREAEMEHDGTSLTPACPICRAIANRSGLNLTAPEAA